MWAAVAEVLGFLARLLTRRQSQSDRAEAEEVGATKQREATQGEAIKTQRDQLEDAARHRPGDAERSLREGEF